MSPTCSEIMLQARDILCNSGHTITPVEDDDDLLLFLLWQSSRDE